MLPLMLIEMGGGGGNNLSLNTPSQSALDSSSNTLSPSSRDSRQQVVAIHKSTQVDSSTAQTKSTRLSLSLACFFALSGVMSASTIPANDPNNLNITDPSGNVFRVMWKAGEKGQVVTDQEGWPRRGQWNTLDSSKYPNTLDYMSIAYKYRSLPKVNLLIRNNMTINHLAVNYKKEGDGGTPWQDMNPQNIVGKWRIKY